jgi:hypothetical protein
MQIARCYFAQIIEKQLRNASRSAGILPCSPKITNPLSASANEDVVIGVLTMDTS